MTAAPKIDWSEHLDVIDMVAELVDRHHQSEHYTRDAAPGRTVWSSNHVVTAPPLLDQLQQATPTSAGDNETGGAGFRSQPAAHLESLDTLMLVDREASLWVRQHGHDDAGMTTVECVRRVGALMASMTRCHRHRPLRQNQQVICCPWHRAEGDVRRWWTQARIVAGWDTPTWRPDATCPMCDARGTLRIRLSAKAGLCVECRDTWDPSTIEHLAMHVMQETTQRQAASRVQPCWCPYPTPVDRIGQLCPACGSARCHRAVMANLGRSTARSVS